MLPSFFAASTALCDRFAPLLLDASLRGTFILALAGIATLILRRASAALRHGIWLLAVVSLLALPVLSAALPAWQILPSAIRAIASSAPSSVASPSASPSVSPAPPNASLAVSSPPAPVSSSAPTPSQTLALPSPKPPSSSPAPTPQNRVALPVTSLLMLLWFAGAALVLIHILLGHLSLAILQRRCK